MLSSAVCLSCTNKRQQFQPEATPDKELAIIGGNDTVTSIQVVSADKDTVIYDTPECYLWYVEDLSDKYKDKPVPCGRNVLFMGRMYKSLMCSLQTRHLFR